MSSRTTRGPVPPGQPPGSRPAAGNPDPQHGTCVLGELAGFTKGVARNVNPVLFELSDMADIKYDVKNLDTIATDWVAKVGTGLATTPLAVLSTAFETHFLSTAQKKNLKRCFDNLVAVGVLPIVAAGNGGYVRDSPHLSY